MASQYKEMTTEELLEGLDEQKARLVQFRMTHTVSPLENPHVIRETKKNIARLQTELRSRELEAEAQK